ncbi:aminoglycoside phosphotransferase family protein [Mucilaginibacter limnophilus]|uniref:Aminoglycoside phosphotransferase family protein n=1 Tax=Mucilaginibacter limnophilus TaxID=1932778 RepID=A0A437MFN1_9SPHI|nr:aminoglycoside phosphotransferase family protein [Mucilaginibacter limnophilus]RVT96470.1 aminoglycoside phosphotransferase family protein [Mucilaginibacter limnophilus]
MQSVANIEEVVLNFNCKVDIGTRKVFGSGHINDTYFLKNASQDGGDYLLQRINHHIFKNVEKLTENMRLVIGHLKNKLNETGKGDADKEVMTLIPANNNKYYYQDTNGDYWRMCYFLSNTHSYDVVENEKQAYEGGKAFGKFQKMLSDLPAGLMYEVIPNFHNLENRLNALDQAIDEDAFGRVKEVTEELEYLAGHRNTMLYFQQPEQKANLPKRVIHNDTKFNNVLLDENDEAQCVVDLDTVMDGYVAYDFGDAIRTIINTTTEDEADLSKIQLNMPLFNAYTKGYLQEAGDFLTEAEVNSLVMGVLLMPYMQSVRFLTDYLSGDSYYKIKFEGHNLQRTRAQLQLFKMLNANAEKLRNTVLNEIENYKAKHVL